jgi:glycosyltransferase involved in cell wall biosynthesis
MVGVAGACGKPQRNPCAGLPVWGRSVRICIVYDCLFPHTVGGAERWYASLAPRLADAGHDVTYLTLRQWDRGETPAIDRRVRVIAAGPRMGLYTADGRRRILPPLVFGTGVLLHMLRAGRRYDAVHTCSFPYFALLAVALVRRLFRFELVVDWFEVWSHSYWRDYLGAFGGRIGLFVQRLCASVRQRAFCFSKLHAQRLRAEGLRGPVSILRGLYGGSLEPHAPAQPDCVVLFAARLIPEKQAPLAVRSIALAKQRIADLQGDFLGEGPQRAQLDAEIAGAGVSDSVRARGFVAAQEVDETMKRAMCLLLPSRREGYGLVVVEAARWGTPSVLVAGEDNAATELIEEGVNGFVAPSADAAQIAGAIVRADEQGMTLRESTAAWFAQNAHSLSVESSIDAVLASYGSPNARS